jgi:maltose O-acetyltransferase
LSRLRIGEACGFNFGCHFELSGEIFIDDDVSVGHQVTFLTQCYDATNPNQRGVPKESKPIRIEKGAWLGARCIVLPGVTIGAGSVIAAQTIVRENVAPNLLVTGNRRISIAKWR